MNFSDPADDDLRAAFAARLRSAPEPSAAMTARTLAATTPPARSPAKNRLRLAARWWAALAAPARFALAAAIVVVGGTIALSTVRITQARVAGDARGQASTVTLDRPHRQIARDASMRISVSDVSGALTRLVAAVAAEHGTIVSTSRRDAARAGETRLIVRVPAGRLARLMQTIARIGVVRERDVRLTDMAAALGTLERRRVAARARVERVPSDASLQTAIATLDAQAARLIDRIAFAALTVDIEPGARELSDVARRPTSSPLARGSLYVASVPGFDGCRRHHIRVAARERASVATVGLRRASS